MTYIFGSFGASLSASICCRNSWDALSATGDAIKAEAELLAGIRVLGQGESEAAPDLVGRIYKVEQASGKTVAQIEAMTSVENAITIERVKRAGKIIGLAPNLHLERDDIVLVAGRRSGVVASGNKIGTELQSSEGMDVVVQIRDVTITSPDYVGKTVAAIRRI